MFSEVSELASALDGLSHRFWPKRADNNKKHVVSGRTYAAIVVLSTINSSMVHGSISVLVCPVQEGLPLSGFLMLSIHFSSCGNSFFHLTLHFPSRYLTSVKDVHSQSANLASTAPIQGDSCPLNCVIF